MSAPLSCRNIRNILSSPAALILIVVLLTPLSASAQKGAPLPPYLTLPPETVVPPDPNARVVREAWGEAEFPKEGGGVLRGEHWNMALRYPATGGAKASGKDVFAKLSPALLQGGWKIVKEYDQNPFSALPHLQKDGRDAWLTMSIWGPTDIRGDLVALGPQPIAFALPAPAAKAEKPDPAKGDFPELPALPDSKFRGA